MEDIPMKNISLEDIIDTCSNGKKTKEAILEDFSIANRENIHEIFRYKKFHNDFTDFLTIYKDEENDDILGIIRPCYYEFFINLLRSLNIEGIRIDNEETTIELLQQIDKLTDIKTIRELENEFPELYKLLVEGRFYMINVRNKSLQEQKTLKHYYYSCAMKESLQGFIKTQAEAYKRYVLDRYKYGLKTLEVDYNDYIKEYFDVEKLNMYIAETYLNVCENTDDLISIDKYLPTLLKYSEELRKSIKSEDKKIDYEKRYRIIALNCRIINLRDRAEKLRNKKVNWNITHTPRKMIARKVGQPRIALFDFKKIERLKEINNEKSEFYTKNKPLLIVTGLKGLRGYIAYIYPNGEVILDKDSKYHKNSAMYNFHIVDFEEFTKLDTQELKSKSTWISHRKGWQEKIEEIINREANEEDKKEVKEFIKKYK